MKTVKQFIRQTDEVVKCNLRQLAVFVGLYRLVAGTFYIRLTSGLLRFSLRMAGYSYLTMSNMRAFLLCPVTFLCLMAALFLGMVLMVVELGGLLTAFQASAYSRKVDSLTILRGGLLKAWEQAEKKNWQLFPLAFADYIVLNSGFIARIFTKIRPFDFVIYEILHEPRAFCVLILIISFLILMGIPTMLVFFACMIEQKQFSDGVRRSRQLLRGQWGQAVALLLSVNLLLVGAVVLLYVAIVVISAILVTILADAHAALAVLLAVCGRFELAVLFLGTVFAVIVDAGALTVVYFQYGQVLANAEPWDFSLPFQRHFKRKWLLAVTGILTGACLFMIADLVYNGGPSDWSLLGETEITAHRGSSKRAPENTMAALEAAMEEMADYSEIDVQTTADGVVVLCHDMNLKRLAGVNRRISHMTWQEVQQVDVGSHFSRQFKGEGIPSLEQVLETFKGRMKLNIELKNMGPDSSLPEQTAALIQEYDMQDQCVITSDRIKYLERVKEFDPNIRTGYILAAAYGRYYENEWIDFISIRSSFASLRLVEAAHENGKAVHVWTVNSKAEMERMQLMGVDTIITDYPARAREILYQEERTKDLMEYLRAVLK